MAAAVINVQDDGRGGGPADGGGPRIQAVAAAAGGRRRQPRGGQLLQAQQPRAHRHLRRLHAQLRRQRVLVAACLVPLPQRDRVAAAAAAVIHLVVDLAARDCRLLCFLLLPAAAAVGAARRLPRIADAVLLAGFPRSPAAPSPQKQTHQTAQHQHGAAPKRHCQQHPQREADRPAYLRRCRRHRDLHGLTHRHQLAPRAHEQHKA
mmetsp:Transcript_30154/g.77425  ORF Transcript_30154/g.77425 Transcript_30154/m.77425 type:complete len:206 (-) Transcript_30154:757-1374(-)